jgi:hypothetical protein
MKTLSLTAVAVTLLALPAAATPLVAPGPAGAIAHFNQDLQDNEAVALPGAGSVGNTVSIRSDDALNRAYMVFNADVDSPNELRGTEPVTAVGGEPVVGRAIFDAIRAENLRGQ